MSELEKKIEAIKKEMTVDAKGIVTFSIRGVSRLSGLNETTLSFSDGRINPKLAKVLKEHGFDVTEFAKKGVVDKATAIVIEFYAFDAGVHCKEEAKISYRAFASVGIRSWGQDLLGWKPSQEISLDFQNQVLASFAELNSKIEAQNQKLLILAPVVEKFEKIEPALDFFEGLNPLLDEASAIIKSNPYQDYKLLRQWIFDMELRPLGRGANIRMGKMLTPFYKICMGADFDFSNDKGAKKYPEAFKPLIKYCYQHILINK